MFSINDKLPGVKELKYFSQFAVPMMLYLYYRNLFLSVNRNHFLSTATATATAPLPALVRQAVAYVNPGLRVRRGIVAQSGGW